MPLIENLYFQRFQGFREDYLEFYNPIIEWLEQSYLESFITNNKFWYFLTLAKEFGAYGDTFTGSFKGLLNDGSHKKGKNINQLEVVAMAYISADKKDLQIFVQVIQVIIFSITHCFIFFLVDHTFVIIGWEQLRWLHWKPLYVSLTF